MSRKSQIIGNCLFRDGLRGFVPIVIISHQDVCLHMLQMIICRPKKFSFPKLSYKTWSFNNFSNFIMFIIIQNRLTLRSPCSSSGIFTTFWKAGLTEDLFTCKCSLVLTNLTGHGLGYVWCLGSETVFILMLFLLDYMC